MGKNFKFNSERQKNMVFSYIRELSNKKMQKKQIAILIKKEFNINPHIRTIEGWINRQSCRFNDKWVMEQALVEKWANELKEPVVKLTEEERQLENMFSLAKARGMIN